MEPYTVQLRNLFLPENPDDARPRCIHSFMHAALILTHTRSAIFEEAIAASDNWNMPEAFGRFIATYQAHHSPRIAALARTLDNKQVCFHHIVACENPLDAHCVWCNLPFCQNHIALHAVKRYSYRACFRCLTNFLVNYRAIDVECSLCYKILHAPPCATCGKLHLCPMYATLAPPTDFCLCPNSFHTNPDKWIHEVLPLVRHIIRATPWPIPFTDKSFLVRAIMQ